MDIDPHFRQVVTYYPKPGVIKDVVFFIAQPTGGTEHAQEERSGSWMVLFSGRQASGDLLRPM